MYIGIKDHRYKASNQVNDYKWIREGKKCNPPAYLIDHLLNIEAIKREGFKTENKVVNPEDHKSEAFRVNYKKGGWVEVLDENGKEVDSGRGKEDYERLKEKYAQ